MSEQPLIVYLNRFVQPDKEQPGVIASIDGITAFGMEDGATTIYLARDAPTRAEGAEMAKAEVEAVLGPDSVKAVTGADELMENRQVMLWLVGTRRQMHRWETQVAAIIRAHLYHQQLGRLTPGSCGSSST